MSRGFPFLPLLMLAAGLPGCDCSSEQVLILGKFTCADTTASGSGAGASYELVLDGTTDGDDCTIESGGLTVHGTRVEHSLTAAHLNGPVTLQLNSDQTFASYAASDGWTTLQLVSGQFAVDTNSDNALGVTWVADHGGSDPPVTNTAGCFRE